MKTKSYFDKIIPDGKISKEFCQIPLKIPQKSNQKIKS